MPTHMDSTATYEASAEETATMSSEGAPTVVAQTRDTAAMHNSTVLIASDSPATPLVGVEAEQRATWKTGESHKDVLPSEHGIYYLADVVIANMKRLQTAMEALQEHINNQLGGPEEKPLHQWNQYTSYSSLELAISSLGLAVEQLEPSNLLEIQASYYRLRARDYSTTISNIAVFILSHVNKKCATCLEDLEAADLDAEDEQAAQTHMTSEVAKVLEHCSSATTRIWTAFDTLSIFLQPVPSGETAATLDATVRNTIASMMEDYKQASIAEHEHRKTTKPRTNHRRMMALFWFVVTVTSVYSTLQSLIPAASLPSLQSTPRHSDTDLYRQTMHLVERTTAVTNLTGEIYNVQLTDLDTRCKTLELAASSHALRIDNLVEALGAPNKNGHYYAAAQNVDAQGVGERVSKLREDVEWRMRRLQNDMQQMRKSMHRIDIRLSKRLDTVGAGR
ncbi:hypothetical protein J1614_007658 [Plenodomus biglobosus]|nr:hypothetical protein J1614_007658 [Plenodomus biglobosus]